MAVEGRAFGGLEEAVAARDEVARLRGRFWAGQAHGQPGWADDLGCFGPAPRGVALVTSWSEVVCLIAARLASCPVPIPRNR